VFHFIEQYSSCPILHSSCGTLEGLAKLNELLTDLKTRQIFNNYSNDNLYAILFAPVKSIAKKSSDSEAASVDRLEELILMIQRLLLKE
jgi:hypothetical protein